MKITIEVEDAHIKDYFRKDGALRKKAIMPIINGINHCTTDLISRESLIEVGVNHKGLLISVRREDEEENVS
ncbi:MAG: hypothetical protein OXH00_02860 [Candidatus Poribacteria bacterium]|nr:hypothetical protein [Candidatus Poribacteria bacterium]